MKHVTEESSRQGRGLAEVQASLAYVSACCLTGGHHSPSSGISASGGSEEEEYSGEAALPSVVPAQTGLNSTGTYTGKRSSGSGPFLSGSLDFQKKTFEHSSINFIVLYHV